MKYQLPCFLVPDLVSNQNNSVKNAAVEPSRLRQATCPLLVHFKMVLRRNPELYPIKHLPGRYLPRFSPAHLETVWLIGNRPIHNNLKAIVSVNRSEYPFNSNSYLEPSTP